jgi:CheY-like chemotaxis protein
VDDNAFNLQALQKLLKIYDLEAQTALNGLQAMNII